MRTNSDPGTSFSALRRSDLTAAYYSGRLAASPVLQIVPLVWNFGYPMPSESHTDSVHSRENSSVTMHLVFATLRPVIVLALQ